MLLNKPTLLLRRPQWAVLAGLVVCSLLIPLLFFRSPIFQRVDGWIASSTHPQEAVPAPAPAVSKFYEWDTRSAFNPVRVEDAGDKSVEELCASFPGHLLDDVQPVLKTGHGVLDVRVRPQLQSVSACLHNLLIFSDLDEDFEGHDIIDVVADIADAPHVFKGVDELDQLDDYRKMRTQAASGDLEAVHATAKEGWKIDKFKFLASISRAWRMRPEKRWYVFYEADTYIVWDNIFRLLENFNPDMPHYFGSPSPGQAWFANGGPGYVVSREAMRRATAGDWSNTTGEYLGSQLTLRNYDDLVHNCCGDSVVGHALSLHDVGLSGLWPSFNPHSPHGVPFSDLYWCSPILTMHKPREEDISGVWRWQFTHRERHRPLLYRDLALSYWNVTIMTTAEDWDNSGWDDFAPPSPSKFFTHDPHASFDACGEACKAHPQCLQWRFHLRECQFIRAIRLGEARKPSIEKYRPEELKEAAKGWPEDDLRYMSGWDGEGIQKWADERKCEPVEWVRPSLERIF